LILSSTQTPCLLML